MDVTKALDMNKLNGLLMGNQRRIGVASGSSSVEDIKSTKNIPNITRQASIIAGLNVALTSKND